MKTLVRIRSVASNKYLRIGYLTYSMSHGGIWFNADANEEDATIFDCTDPSLGIKAVGLGGGLDYFGASPNQAVLGSAPRLTIEGEWSNCAIKADDLGTYLRYYREDKNTYTDCLFFSADQVSGDDEKFIIEKVEEHKVSSQVRIKSNHNNKYFRFAVGDAWWYAYADATFEEAALFNISDLDQGIKVVGICHKISNWGNGSEFHNSYFNYGDTGSTFILFNDESAAVVRQWEIEKASDGVSIYSKDSKEYLGLYSYTNSELYVVGENKPYKKTCVFTIDKRTQIERKGLGTFDHVVVLMLENRSFDNLLGYLYEDGVPDGASYAGL
ncbi:MAG: hypothetical protein GKR95_25785 [Gammaproteobacteria bacterium]|nr:hypothetical protein [Gammaproteobacteria bacterium]